MKKAVLLEILEATQPRLVSFDVFDTLIWRPFQEPTELFAHLGQAYESVGIKIRDFTPSQLRELRRTAEGECRSRVASREVSINDIAGQLCDRLGVSEPHRLVQAEIACEENLLFADAEFFSFIDHLHERGIPYALCSDMYLSSSQVLQLLVQAAEKSGYRLHEPQIVLVSSEVGIGKAAGLFDLLLEKTKLRADEILHLGDNWRADVEGARRKGIRSHHVKRTCPTAEKLLAAEDDYTDNEDLVGHDFGLTVTRKQALADALVSRSDLDHYTYGLFIAGPVIASLAAWVVAHCRKEGWQQVFALMREGHLLTPVIRRIAEVTGADIAVENLWVSRFATRVAAAAHSNTGHDSDLMERLDLPDVDSTLLSELGLWNKDLSEAWHRAGIPDPASNSDSADERIQFLLEWVKINPSAAAAVRSRVSLASDGMRSYLRQAGFGNTSQTVIVDLGWGGSIQRALAEVASNTMGCTEMIGLYLGTDLRIRKLEPPLCSYRAFMFDANVPQRSAKIAHRTPEILEQCCMPSNGTLRSYAADGTPVCSEDVISEEQTAQRTDLQRGIFKFVDEWMPRFVASRGGTALPDEFEMLAERSRRILSRALDAPLLSEVELFGSWDHDVNFGSDRRKALLGDEATESVIKDRKRRSPYELTMEQCFWPQGAFVRLGIPFRNKSNSAGVARNTLIFRLSMLSNRALCVAYVAASFVVPKSLLRQLGEPCRYETFPSDSEGEQPQAARNPKRGSAPDEVKRKATLSIWSVLPSGFQKRWNALPYVHVEP
jgi:FMN phosphatase YigB (HAD superfamily)